MRSAVKLFPAFAACWLLAPAAWAHPHEFLQTGATIGPGGTSSFLWQINNATGAAGAVSSGVAFQPEGWSQILVVKATDLTTGITTSPGDFTWTATATSGNQFTFALQTLLDPSTGGLETAGPMANFNPTQSYIWQWLNWQGAYTGPSTSAALTASTIFDTSQFANSINGTFSFQLDLPNQAIDLVYTPQTPAAVPEPGTLGLVGLGLLVVARRASRGRGR